jgi:hypothetical protein
MDKFIETIFASPLANLFVITGLLLLVIAAVGNISSQIQPAKGGRIAAGILGSILVCIGLVMYSRASQPDPSTGEFSPPTVSPTSALPGAAASAVQSTAVPPVTVPSAASSTSSFHVVEVFLRADPFDYVGPCPVAVTFSGRISAVGGSGRVSYKFLRSDGASAPVQTLSFTSPGSQDLNETWTLGGAGFNYSGWQSLHIFEPEEMTSEQAHFRIQCQ